jgi:uncharacterized protein (DUF58 family)
MIRPTKKSILIVAIAIFPALVPVFLDVGPWPWVISLVPIAAALLADIFFSPRLDEVHVEAERRHTFYLGEKATIPIKVVFRSPHRRKAIEVAGDFAGPILPPKPAVVSGELLGIIELSPHARGRIHSSQLWIRWTGPLGLFEKITTTNFALEADIVPNTKAVQRAAIRLATHSTLLVGAKTQNQRGEGSEFDALRRYVQGLDTRFIDWKASAKHRNLLWREHRVERNHNVILAIDSGRLMSEPIDDYTRLDHAINAGLMVGYVSLRAGDNVGLLTFDSEVRTFIPPLKGVSSAQLLAKHLAPVTYSADEANYTLAITELGTKVKRRSVIIVLTEFIDTIGAELLIENLGRLAKRHLIVFVTLRDPFLKNSQETLPRDIVEVGKTTLAFELESERRLVFKELQRLGVFVVDALPENLSVELINTYLEIHRRELL